MKSDLFPYLNDISFAERDPAVIEREIIGGFEEAYRLQYGEERRLYPGDPVRLYLETIAFVITQQRHLIDYSAKQNLLAYSEGDALEHLGAHLGVVRLAAQPALTTLKFTLSAPQIGSIVIPAGTRATPGGGDIVFTTLKPLEIPAGEIVAETTAECLTTGEAGNGFLAGQVRKIVDPFPWQMNVENTTTSSGGADVESDENLRERIQLAPEAFSNAGSKGAYRYWARTAHQSIVDVEVLGPPDTEPGNVELYPLMTGGELPSQEILDLVYETCDAEDKRPDTDFVHVFPPVPVAYDLKVTYWIDRSRATQAAAIQKAAGEAVQAWLLWQRSKLGRDLNPDELIHRVKAAGAKRLDIVSPSFAVLASSQVAIPGTVEVMFGGLEDA